MKPRDAARALIAAGWLAGLLCITAGLPVLAAACPAHPGPHLLNQEGFQLT